MREEIKQALEVIKSECNNTPTCSECVFKDFVGCGVSLELFEGDRPCDWDIKELEEKK